MSDNNHVTHVKQDFLWVKRPVRSERDESNPPYVNISVRDDGEELIVKPVSGGAVTGNSIKMHDGKMEVPRIGSAIAPTVFDDFPIPFETTYDSDTDVYRVDLTKPVFSTSIDNITTFIRHTAGTNGSKRHMGKSELKELFGVDSNTELVDKLESVLQGDSIDYNVNITINLNKDGYRQLAQYVLNESD